MILYAVHDFRPKRAALGMMARPRGENSAITTSPHQRP